MITQWERLYRRESFYAYSFWGVYLEIEDGFTICVLSLIVPQLFHIINRFIELKTVKGGLSDDCDFLKRGSHLRGGEDILSPRPSSSKMCDKPPSISKDIITGHALKDIGSCMFCE